jgi:RNA 2',3'-cyclic 3'-phosphodiesterase
MSVSQIRSFVSIDIEDPAILSAVTSVTSSLIGLGGDLKPVERDNIHLTLKFLGYVSQPKLEQVKSSLGRLGFRPFRMEIKGAGTFPSVSRMNIVWVGIGEGWPEVQKIYEQTERIFFELGFARENRSFTPHVTVARVKSSRNTREMAEFLQSLSEKSFGSYKIDSVRLKQSILFRSGPTYSTLLEVKAGD